jgi:hypothetical protein
MKYLIAVSLHLSATKPGRPVLRDMTDSDYVVLEPGERITEKYLDAYCKKLKCKFMNKIKKSGQGLKITVSPLAVTPIEED